MGKCMVKKKKTCLWIKVVLCMMLLVCFGMVNPKEVKASGDADEAWSWISYDNSKQGKVTLKLCQYSSFYVHFENENGNMKIISVTVTFKKNGKTMATDTVSSSSSSSYLTWCRTDALTLSETGTYVLERKATTSTGETISWNPLSVTVYDVNACGTSLVSSQSSLRVELGGSGQVTAKMTGGIPLYSGKKRFLPDSVYIEWDCKDSKVSCTYGGWFDSDGDGIRDANTITVKGMSGGDTTLMLYLKESTSDKIVASAKVQVTVEKVYTVSYDANGGSGAPSAQKKYHGTPLTLSTAQPTRYGYTFMGWATSRTASSAAYKPGGSYTDNSNATLYAVWKSNAQKIQTISVQSKFERTYKTNDKFSLGAKAVGKLSYSSSDTKVAAVSSSGQISVKGAGIAVITVNAAETMEYKAASVKVTVSIKPAKPVVSLESKKQGTLTIIWNEGANLDGYGIVLSDTKDFTNNQIYVLEQNSGTTWRVANEDGVRKTSIVRSGNKVKWTVTNLKAGTRYYVMVSGSAGNWELDGAFSDVKSAVVLKGKEKQTIKVNTKISKVFKKNGVFSLGAKAAGKLSYISSDKSVATVSSTGKVTMKNYGKTIITVSAAATSRYQGASIKVTVTITPAKTSLNSVTSEGTGGIMLKYSKVSGADGYEINVSTSSKFVKVQKGGKVTKTSVLIRNLQSGKIYYIRVRAYKKVKGQIIYAPWSNIKKIKVI